MAYLNEGAVSLANVNWDTGTGFADAAVLVIASGSQTITTQLDNSGLTAGINTLDILPGFTGRIGGAGYGSLKFDADESAINRVVYNAGGGSLYLQAAGDNNIISNFWMSSLGSCYLTGGTFTNTVLGQGSLSVDATTVLTTSTLSGGTAIIQANATAITTLNVTGGSHVLKRGATTINVYGRGRLTIDCSTVAITTLNILSPEAEVTLLSSGTITTVNNWGRLLAEKVSRAIIFTTYNEGPAGFFVSNPSYITYTNAIGRLGAKNI